MFFNKDVPCEKLEDQGKEPSLCPIPQTWSNSNKISGAAAEHQCSTVPPQKITKYNTSVSPTQLKVCTQPSESVWQGRQTAGPFMHTFHNAAIYSL